jgi:hypothetical protein
MSDDTVTTKRCRICEELKPLDDFGSHRAHADGKQNYCRPCRNLLNKNMLTPEQRERKKANAQRFVFRERVKVRRRRELHGVTQAEFELLVAAQDGRCAICQHTETQEHRALVIDHHHESGRVRGLICSRCNKALGGFRDDPAILLAAAEYLTHQDDLLAFLDQA